MKISINILTWNNKDTIIELLDAVYQEMKGFEHEYIIVDNGSDDGTLNLINNWIVVNLEDNFTFIKNNSNYGISVGKNQGINGSTGDYIIMLDGDVVPVANSLKMLIDWMEANPEKHALGMYPNKFTQTKEHAEAYCRKFIVREKPYKCCCLYYGIFKASMFKDGLRMSTYGEFGKPGYGWEDHDFFKRMQTYGYDQYVTHINSERGKYYHAINSSIRAMGHSEYQRTSMERSKLFKKVWTENAA